MLPVEFSVVDLGITHDVVRVQINRCSTGFTGLGENQGSPLTRYHELKVV